MLCPVCRALNEAAAETCFSCGRNLYLLAKDTLLANRYRIEARLGQGGMAIVYRAHDEMLDEVVAVKLLRPEVATDPDMARRFRGEIRLARRVRHRNVCAIHEYGEDGHLRFIVMDFVDGVDLKKVLQQQGALSWEEAFAAAIQVAEGLQAVHEAGIVHRDLKTPNIMRDSRGAVRLMDFGIAKNVEDPQATTATVAGQIVGTPEYMSPEQVRGETLDARSDLYALGIVVYELFTADVPFHGQTPVATLFLQLEQPPPLASPGKRMPAPLVPVLERVLSKRREDRQASAAELAEELRHARDAALGPRAPNPARLRAPYVASAAVPATDEKTWAAAPTPMPDVTPVPAATHVPAWPPAHPVMAPAPPAARAPSVHVLAVAAVAAALLTTAAGIALVVQRARSAGVESPPVSRVSPPVEGGAVDALGTQAPVVGAPTAPGGAPPVPAAPARVAPPMAPRVPSTSATKAPPVVTSAPRSAVAVAPSPLPVLPLVAPTAPTPAPASAPGSSGARAAEGEGGLIVLVEPWAAVAVDGTSYGTTPLQRIPLAAGKHTVLIENPRYRPFYRRVTIVGGQTTRLSVDLRVDAVPKPP